MDSNFIDYSSEFSSVFVSEIKHDDVTKIEISLDFISVKQAR